MIELRRIVLVNWHMMVKADLDLSKVYTTEYVCKGLGKELVK